MLRILNKKKKSLLHYFLDQKIVLQYTDILNIWTIYTTCSMYGIILRIISGIIRMILDFNLPSELNTYNIVRIKIDHRTKPFLQFFSFYIAMFIHINYFNFRVEA